MDVNQINTTRTLCWTVCCYHEVVVMDEDHTVFPVKYSQTCLLWPSKGTVKYGHIRQEVV